MREEGRGKLWLALAAVAIVAIIIVVAFVLKNGEAVSRPLEQKKISSSRIVEAVPSKGVADLSERSGQETASPLSDETEDKKESADSESVLQTEQEKLLAATELLVEEFDSLVDAWRGQSGGKEKAKSITMADVDQFAAAFRKIPKERRDECIHRALNLIPDENVMLLAGVLMDKSMDKEIVETVYNDILNRDEDVKKPILQEIYKDKSHPCWADTAWILDVTGELPTPLARGTAISP